MKAEPSRLITWKFTEDLELLMAPCCQ